MSQEPLFRPEAVEHRARGTREGDILRIDDRWSGVTYRLVVLVALAALVFITVVPVNEYASGPAVVRFEGRRELAATAAGVVDEVNVTPGQRVQEGQVLVRLHGEDQEEELARARTEFELQLARLLRDPTDTVAKQTLSALRAKVDQAKNELLSRTLRAPIASVVSEIHTRVGQRLAEGDVALTLAPNNAQAYVLAVVPGDYRPMLAPGQEVRFSLDGFKFAYSTLELERVSDETTGPAEVKRYFGPEIADAVTLEPGAKALVRARVPTRTFQFEGQAYGYFDGLTGLAEG
jgi:membrane fusion protein (multidrug efflux system)